MHALLPLLKLHHVTQCNPHLRMLDIMVDPAMCNGSHFLGPGMCEKWFTSSYTVPSSIAISNLQHSSTIRSTHCAKQLTRT